MSFARARGRLRERGRRAIRRRRADVYTAACAACHGGDGRGRRRRARSASTLPLPDFTDCDFAVARAESRLVRDRASRRARCAASTASCPRSSEALRPPRKSKQRSRTSAPSARDARWPRGELNLPRALFTEKAYPEDEAVITTTIVTRGPGLVDSRVPLGATLRRRQPDRDQPADHARRSRRAARLEERHRRPRRSASSTRCATSLERGAILRVGGELVLPTGDEARGFGKGTTVFESFVLFGKLLPSDAFVQLQGIVELPNDSALEDELVARAALRPDLDRATRRSAAPGLRSSRCSVRASSERRRRRPMGPRSAAPGVVEHSPACAWRAAGVRVPVTDRGNRSDGARVLSVVGLVRRRRAARVVAQPLLLRCRSARCTVTVKAKPSGADRVKDRARRRPIDEHESSRDRCRAQPHVGSRRGCGWRSGFWRSAPASLRCVPPSAQDGAGDARARHHRRACTRSSARLHSIPTTSSRLFFPRRHILCKWFRPQGFSTSAPTRFEL